MEHQGYLKVDWRKVSHDAHAGRSVVEKKVHAIQEQITSITDPAASPAVVRRRNGKPWLDKVRTFILLSMYHVVCASFRLKPNLFSAESDSSQQSLLVWWLPRRTTAGLSILKKRPDRKLNPDLPSIQLYFFAQCHGEIYDVRHLLLTM